MPIADASRIAAGFRHALLLLVLTAGLMVLGVLFAGTARADERDTAGDAIGAVVRDAGEATGNDGVAAGRDEESAQGDDESTQRDGDESAQRDDESAQRDDESTQRDGDESTQRDDESTQRDDESAQRDAESKSGEGATEPAVDSTETVRAVSHGTGAASEVSTARESAGLVSSAPGDTADHTADPPVTDIARNASDATGTAADTARNASDTTGTAADTARNASDALNPPGDLVARATDTTGGALGSPEVPGDLIARVTGTTGEAAGGVEPLGDLVMGTAGELLPGVVEPPPGDLVAGVVGIADGGVLGALEAPLDLAVGTADEISAVLETPGDLVAAVVDTGAEAVGVLGAAVAITAGALQDRGLAEITVTVAVAVAGSDTGARLVDARPGTTSGKPGVGFSRGYLPQPAPAGEAVLARPPATGGSAAIGTPVHAAAPYGGPVLLAYSGGILTSAAGGATTDGTPLRPLASLPVTAPSPSSGGGSGLTSALLPLAAMAVPPALSRRLRHARGGHLASLCPSPGERPG